MAICKKCGCFTKETMKFCPKCGAPQQAAAAAPKQTAGAEQEKPKTATPAANADATRVFTTKTVQNAAPAKAADKKAAAKATAKASDKKAAAKAAAKASDKEAASKAAAKASEDISATKVVPAKASAKKAAAKAPAKTPGKKPASKAEQPAKRKKSKAPKVIVIIMILALIGVGGAVAYRYFYGGRSQLSAFKVNCSEFTDALNTVLAEDESTSLHLNTSKWTASDSTASFEYVGRGFSLRAKTSKDGDFSSPIRELRVGPTDEAEGQTLAVMSVIALENGKDKQTVLTDMESIKEMRIDKMSYDVVAFTYDRDKDELVLVPSQGAKSPEHYGASADQSTPDTAASVYVAGESFIRAGGKYIFSDGKSILCRDKVTGSDKKVIDAVNDGTLLSDGTTVYYVEPQQSGGKVCSVRVDGTDSRTLFSSEENVTLLHRRGKQLYYIKESLTSPDDYVFCKYNLETREQRQYNDVALASNRVVIEGDLMYCSKTAQSVTDIQNISAYCFNFATDEYTEVLKNCIVAAHGYFNGAGNPCLDSHNVDETGTKLSNHYLYTSVDGELKKSPEITVNATLLLASPATNETILYDNSNKEYYWFNRKTGKTQKLDLPEMCSFTYDVAHPEKIYACVTEGDSEKRTLKKLYLIENGEMKEYLFGAKPVAPDLSPVIANNFILDVGFNAFPIAEMPQQHAKTEPSTAATTAPASTAAADYSSYVGEWKEEGEVSYSLTVLSAEDGKVSFRVEAVYTDFEDGNTVSAEVDGAALTNGKASFTCTDSSDNTATGTLTMKDGVILLKITSAHEGLVPALECDAELKKSTGE